MRNFFSLLFLCIAGFFIYLLGILAFMNMGLAKYFILIFLLLPTVFLAGLGAVLHANMAWRKSVGLVFLCGSLFSAFIVLVAVCFSMEPNLREKFPAEMLAPFNQYPSGIITNLVFFLIGWGLLQAAKGRITPSSAKDPSEMGA
jgi:hypothetical protein